ncbi:YD repeat-containing protein [Zunongwangia mangrovi]|uniref:YD repeat-containing protein n=2 Tax=Zunongwangia mangrovi TaxID=1334022 RepID=A0A1I1NCF4_9FLAO|nr:YD repeat-containing protein [Zunongwangia mangrovi]
MIGSAQVENKWQPDSIYLNRQVKRIIVYLNSPKDLSEIIEFDKNGNRIKSIKYSASYNRRTRKSKKIDEIHRYKYDDQGRLIKIKDSIGRDSTTFVYDSNNRLISRTKNLGNFIYNKSYLYNPFKTTTTRKRESAVVYHKTKEYDKDFYVNKFYGYVLNPKLKKKKITYSENDSLVKSQIMSYKDYDDLQRFEENKIIQNQFNSENRLIKSKVKSTFLNNRLNEYTLYYYYYKNGLLKSIGGYVGWYFKYEFWE